jgi:UDP-hydrolysing UDP-N-acetyl-D-glucosamine 2-epimerase
MITPKICVITGTRADYGLLNFLIKELHNDPDVSLQIIATGMHLSGDFGETYREILRDGFAITEKVPLLEPGDDGLAIARSVGAGTTALAESLDRLRPDFVVLLGDRFEMLAAASAAYFLRIPIAHIGGGDITEGAFDDAIRHAITKMASLHFPTNEKSARVIEQLGEPPSIIFNVGSPGIEYIHRAQILSRDDFEEATGYRFQKRNILVTYHPETMADASPSDQFRQVLSALEDLSSDTGMIFTKANADTGGRQINRMIDEYVAGHERACAFTNLGQVRYISAVKHCDVVVGNSSSGIYEAPSLETFTVNIGQRQYGRLMAPSVIHCDCKRDAISAAISRAFGVAEDFKFTNPYESMTRPSRAMATRIKTACSMRKTGAKPFVVLDRN